MELRHLRSFLAVADTLHFRRAAEQIGLTQPGLSQQIAALEAELGAELFDRTRRRVEMTDAGKLLADRARRILGELSDALEEVRQLGKGAHQRLRLGSTDYINLPIIGPLLQELAARHPDVVVERRDLAPGEVPGALTERTLDVGFTHFPIVQPTLAYRIVLEGHWVVVLRREHPLAAEESVPLRALAGEPIILFDRRINPRLHDALVARCESAGFSPRIVYSTTQVYAGLGLVAQGVGGFLIGSYVLRELPEGLVARRLDVPELRLQLCAVWRADDRTPAIRGFLEALRVVTRPPAVRK
jgi:DNA-binding transcriptional LysR family regulator